MGEVVRWAARVQGSVALAVAAGPAVACTICLSAVDISPGQRLDNADRAVIAVPARTGGWQIVEDIKGMEPVEPAALGNVMPVGENDEPVLFLRDGLGHRWSAFGNVAIKYADWLRSVARTPAPDANGVGDAAGAWQPRLQIAMQQVDSDDPQIEAMAEGDLARAPYPALLALARKLKTEEVFAHLADQTDGSEGANCSTRLCQAMQHLSQDKRSSQRAPFIHMLGRTGDHAALSFIDAEIASASENGDARDLAALLAADLEIRGRSRIRWIEEHYLLDPRRGLHEIEAALMALRLHGEHTTAVSRRDVAASYTRFIEARPRMAGLVAADLAAWKDWSATGAFVAILNGDMIADPGGNFAALSYVLQSEDKISAAKLELPRE